MKLARDIMSLSTFKRDSNKVMRQMKKTKEPVVLTVNGKAAVVVQDAESDIESSFKWGCRAWGEGNAKQRVQKLRRAIRKQLTSSPFACPVAPWSEQLGVSIRRLIVGRYRVLFTVRGRTVTILQVSSS